MDTKQLIMILTIILTIILAIIIYEELKRIKNMSQYDC